ncbi:biotin--[acetyl-CoA-carboxylase] ligase [Microcella alkalica]|uniref:biotin--[biotin carboxyl-carrier protein] ligase n=1 Tax=Microcella alkalica TaxID=355930 RepID=A0A839EEV2_9MICO|nr:BirA family biotin operon repressor/biotin-[acetyl-CoA-carboxylase] ligase [Microcella alkalica]
MPKIDRVGVGRGPFGVEWRDSCPSTNSELVRRAAELPDFAVLATDDQTAGRGRLDRVWSAPPGASLAISVFIRLDAAPADPQGLGWLPLLAGVAMTRAVRELGAECAGLKWPNDVLVRGRKISGVLTELTAHGVVIGSGLNTRMTEEQLPVPTATSLAIEGIVDVETDALLADRVLAAYLGALRDLVAQWREAPTGAALRPIVVPVLDTLGAAVRVDQPGLAPLRGVAEGLDDDGRLLVRSGEGSSPVVAVSAGDVTHLRYE